MRIEVYFNFIFYNITIYLYQSKSKCYEESWLLIQI